MNGPEHYREAERLLALSDTRTGGALRRDGFDVIAQAQVHATLATVPADTMRMWDSLREVFLRRITEDRAIDTFRRVWAEADARGETGDRVRQALAAVVREVLL